MGWLEAAPPLRRRSAADGERRRVQRWCSRRRSRRPGSCGLAVIVAPAAGDAPTPGMYAPVRPGTPARRSRVFDPVGADGAGIADVLVEGHRGELGGDRRPLAVGQRPLQMRLDGGPVDVGDARFQEIGQIGQQPVGVPAVGGDEDLQSPGAHGLPDRHDVVAAAGSSGFGKGRRIGAGGRVDAACCLGPASPSALPPRRSLLSAGEGAISAGLVTGPADLFRSTSVTWGAPDPAAMHRP